MKTVFPNGKKGDGRYDFCHIFDSVGEFVEYAEGESGLPDSRRASRTESEWDGGFHKLNWSDTVMAAKDGWSDIRPDVDHLVRSVADNFRHQLPQETLTPTFSVDGGAVNIDLFLEGEPECMVQFQPEMISRAGRVVSIIIDACFNSYVDADVVLKRGTSLMALLETLNLLHHNTEVWVECSVDGDYYGGRCSASLLVKVKDEREQFDVNSIMFAVAHPDWLRRLCFSAWERENQPVRNKFGFNAGRGYGQANGLRRVELSGAAVVIEAPRGMQDPSVRMPEDWLKNTLAGIGLEYD
jgi:hypothetical protein